MAGRLKKNNTDEDSREDFMKTEIWNAIEKREHACAPGKKKRFQFSRESDS